METVLPRLGHRGRYPADMFEAKPMLTLMTNAKT